MGLEDLRSQKAVFQTSWGSEGIDETVGHELITVTSGTGDIKAHCSILSPCVYDLEFSVIIQNKLLYVFSMCVDWRAAVGVSSILGPRVIQSSGYPLPAKPTHQSNYLFS